MLVFEVSRYSTRLLNTTGLDCRPAAADP